MKATALSTAILTMAMLVLYFLLDIELFKTFSITFGAIFYHFAMRLSVGYYYQKKYNNIIDYNDERFYVGEAEKRIYQKINVKDLKKYLPTYDIDTFSIKEHKYEDIAMAMCQAELVHKTIFIFSFFPVLASICFGSIEVFIISSVLSALFDLLFVIVQRYNRQRIMRLIKHKSNKPSNK